MHDKTAANVHSCRLKLSPDPSFPSYLPPLLGFSSCLKKLRQRCLASEDHPESLEWFDSLAAVRKERQRQCLLPEWWIIHPFSSASFLWETAIMFIYAFAFASLPFGISFIALDSEKIRRDRVNLFVYPFFWLEIFTRCTTGVKDYERKLVELRQKNIFKSYVKGFFLIDLLTSLPYGDLTYRWKKVAGPDSSVLVTLINIIPMLKLTRYVTFHSYLLQLLLHLRVKEAKAKIMVTLLLSLYVVHWFACLCYLAQVLVIHIRKISVDECETCWLKNVSNGDIFSIYRQALFIIIQNLTASGFGTIEPKSEDRIFLCTLLMILGRIFEAYIVVMYLQIKIGSEAAELKYREIIDQLSAYTRQKQLPAYMKKRLMSYYQHRFENNYFREKAILADLSEQLRQEILLHSCRRLVENVAIFRTLPEQGLLSIVANLTFEYYLPKDIIVKAGTPGDCMFFLASGTVAVLTSTGKEVVDLSSVKELPDGAHFGEIALMAPDQRRVASVLAIEVCEVYRLDRKDFRKCVAIHGDLLSKFERIASERIRRTFMIEKQHKRSLLSVSR